MSKTKTKTKVKAVKAMDKDMLWERCKKLLEVHHRLKLLAAFNKIYNDTPRTERRK